MRKHITPASVIALIALAFSVGTGGAYAASKLITGKQIKNGTIQLKDISKSTQSSLKVGQPGPAGAPGTNGAPGLNGAPGPRGFSAWNAIPSGTTVTGNAIFDTQSGETGDYRYSVDLPGIAPVALTTTTVNFAADANPDTIDDDAACTGTVNAPTAPAGKVCVYRSSSGAGVSSIQAYAATLETRGFVIRFVNTAPAADPYVSATWAYTAP